MHINSNTAASRINKAMSEQKGSKRSHLLVLFREVVVPRHLVDALRHADYVPLEIKNGLAHYALSSIPRSGVDLLVEPGVLTEKSIL